jgi:hypothetical protein
MIIKYNHHGTEVFVDEELKGKHRDNCLCFKCGRFNPGMPETNCPKANLLYAVCIAESMTTPVYECADYLNKL